MKEKRSRDEHVGEEKRVSEACKHKIKTDVTTLRPKRLSIKELTAATDLDGARGKAENE